LPEDVWQGRDVFLHAELARAQIME